jgi:trehalose-6-phosphate synthase
VQHARRALELKDKTRTARMRKLRAEVRRHDVSWWAGSFLASALAERPERPVTSIRAT